MFVSRLFLPERRFKQPGPSFFVVLYVLFMSTNKSLFFPALILSSLLLNFCSRGIFNLTSTLSILK